MNPVVVIGAGLAGLSAACYLTGRGYDVTVVEREEVPGGRAGVLHRDGFTFDTGPTVLTMPDLIADAVRAAAVTDADLTSCCRCAGSTRRTGPASPTAARSTSAPAARRCGRRSPRPAAALTRPPSTRSSTGCASSIWWRCRTSSTGTTTPRSACCLASRCCPAGTAGRLRPARRGGAEAVRRSPAAPAVQLPGDVRRAGARSALALYAVITYMDSIEGVWFPEGGMHAVPTIMAQVAEKAGATFRYGDPVETILRSPTGRVAGVRTASGARIMADAVVCTLDLPTAYAQLLGDLRPPRAARRGQYSPSAVVWHVGVRGVPEPPVAHHNIHFGQEWSEAFDALQRGRLMPDPSRLVTIPSLDDSTLAPAGCSTLYVLEPVPNLSGKINWSTEAQLLRERLHAFLAGRDIRAR